MLIAAHPTYLLRAREIAVMKQKSIALLVTTLLALPLAASALPCSTCTAPMQHPTIRNEVPHQHCSGISESSSSRSVACESKHSSCPQAGQLCMASPQRIVKQELRRATPVLAAIAEDRNLNVTTLVTQLDTALRKTSPFFSPQPILALRI